MAFPEDKIRQIEDFELPELRARLKFKTGEQRFGDMTGQDHERIRRDIAELEDLLAKLKGGEPI